MKPRISVDVIIRHEAGIVLVERKFEPYGWALPGGFVEYGETLEEAARREVREETNLALDGLEQFHAYSDPDRDPRGHTVTMVFTAQGNGDLKAGDDAQSALVFGEDNLPELVFDHKKIVEDYLNSV